MEYKERQSPGTTLVEVSGAAKLQRIFFALVATGLAYALHAGLQWLSLTFELETKLRNFDYVVRLTTVLFGILLYFVLTRNAFLAKFVSESAEELFERVTWPSKDETYKSTFVVIIFVVISSLFLGFVDWVSALIMRGVL